MEENGGKNAAESRKDHLPAGDPGLNLENNEDNANTTTYKTTSEYAAALNLWLWQCYYWQCWSASLPYFVAQSHAQATDVNKNLPSVYFPNQNFFVLRQDATRGPVTVGQGIQNLPNLPIIGTEYLLPPIWKRFAAECIDCFIFIILKLIATYIAVDFFEIIDIEKFDLELFRDEHFIYRTALEMTSELLILETIHRFLVCFFEALCLHRGTSAPGGATPGKSVMKLRVVSCTQISMLENNRVRVHPAQDIGFGWSLLRCFIKNFSLAFFLPACLTVFFFQHNRTAYDIICNCVVVEDLPQQPPRRNN